MALVIGLACNSTDAAAPLAPNDAAFGSVHVDPERHGSPTEGRARDAQSGSVRPVVCRRRDPLETSGVFGPAGGTLVVGESRLLIPGGALRDTVTITATIVGDTTSTIHFQPSGLTFRKAAGLKVSGVHCTLPRGSGLTIAYLGARGEVLEVIPGVYYPRFKTVAAPIRHFSGYAIAFREE